MDVKSSPGTFRSVWQTVKKLCISVYCKTVFSVLDVEELEQRLQESEGFQFSTFKKDYLIEIPDGSLVHVRAEPFKRKCSETTAKTQKKEQWSET